MKKQTGIWLDTEKAIVITLNDHGYSLRIIESEIESRERFDGEKKKFGRFGSQFLNDETKRKRRVEEQTNKYLKRIFNNVKHVNEIVLFGPASMKRKLADLIKSDISLAEKLKAVKTADTMTQNQMVAWVKKFYKNNIVTKV
jgi:stalled ribosome rescue protein Dom34